jgi:hypothetical protein
MRMKIVSLLRQVARCADKLLAVHLRMDLVYGFRNR